MKRLLFPFGVVLIILFHSCGNKSDKPEPQNTDYPVSMTSFDSLKLGMTKAEVEALLQTQIKLKHITVDGGFSDTFNTKYKDIPIVIYLNESDEKSVATLAGIQTENAWFKTSSGIGVGSDKASVIDAYPDFKKYIAPIYETYPERSKTKSVVAVADSVYNRAMLFHIVNKKVAAVEIRSYYEFD